MNDVTANPPAVEPGRWTPTRWFVVIALVFAAHVALVFLFGEKREPVPRVATMIPTLTLANTSDELVALYDPTLFALPHQRDFANAAWLKLRPINPPTFHWTEPPRPLPFSADGLGAVFNQFIKTNVPVAREQLDLRPVLEMTTPSLTEESALAQNSAMQIVGDLARRQLPSAISLTNWPYADVLAPCAVQVLVDATGGVVSTALLESSNYKVADDKALEITRTLRFTPSSGLTFGKIIFNWQTVPITNEINR